MDLQQSDFDLLQAFVRRADQPAFAALVKRHVDLVYATAFRTVQDQGAAEEVAQIVFGVLAKKAWHFAPDDSLPAWLYKTALLQSRHRLRGEMRRRRREQTAAELGTTMNSPDEEPALRALIPMLNEGLLSLREKDRAALLLRFYENRSLRDVGASLGVGEDAAQKRVGSALDKLSQFFHRRGFKTASAAAATNALQRTAISAPASVVNSVVLAAGQAAPPAMFGLAGVLTRAAALTKWQTAYTCLALAAGPVFWQWNACHKAEVQTAQYSTALSQTQTQLLAIQNEMESLNETSARLTSTAAMPSDAAKKYADWKARLRELLTGANYRWPDDSPFVRIPKSVLSKIDLNNPVTQPGILSQPARELLGLTPEERASIEQAMQDQIAAVNDVMQTNIYETNHQTEYGGHFWIPDSAVASQIWYVPPMGDQAATLGANFQETLQNILGNERWPLVQSALQVQGPGSAQQVLGLSADKDQLETGVWIENQNGQLLLSYGITTGVSTMTTGGTPLQAFAGGADVVASNEGGESPFDDLSSLPKPLLQRMQSWISQQAASRVPKESTP